MQHYELFMIACKISSGVFSGELFFKVKLPGDGWHEGVASRRYFRTPDNLPLETDAPAVDDEDGLVAAVVLRQNGATAQISIPDGEVITVEKTQLTEHQFKDAECVPV
jgi:hypothetical protein